MTRPAFHILSPGGTLYVVTFDRRIARAYRRELSAQWGGRFVIHIIHDDSKGTKMSAKTIITATVASISSSCVSSEVVAMEKATS